ncbi:MAG: hypothetical protein GY870_01985 [archaeon]|nr:hypothetical protein [archaeon]
MANKTKKSKKELIPYTYIGENDGLVFVTPQELFTLNISPEEALERETANLFGKYLKGTFKGFNNARKTKYGNENNTKIETTSEFWNNFEKKANSMGVDLIGYTTVNKNFIFKNLKVYGKNAIILGMEMKWDQMKLAPNVLCEIECFRVYDELGVITIELTEFLKGEGYKCEAHHPFGGKLLFPPHAIQAGLGIKGQNGLTVTPEFGPRQRWAIITTDANIPELKARDFSKMEDFCKKCGACVKNCLGGAAYKEPIEKMEGCGVLTHIERPKCINSILENSYCSVCLRICPLGHPSKIEKNG